MKMLSGYLRLSMDIFQICWNFTRLSKVIYGYLSNLLEFHQVIYRYLSVIYQLSFGYFSFMCVWIWQPGLFLWRCRLEIPVAVRQILMLQFWVGVILPVHPVWYGNLGGFHGARWRGLVCQMWHGAWCQFNILKNAFLFVFVCSFC